MKRQVSSRDGVAFLSLDRSAFGERVSMTPLTRALLMSQRDSLSWTERIGNVSYDGQCESHLDHDVGVGH